MKTLRILWMAAALCVCTSMAGKAQTADITVVVKGIREAKGKVMVAAGCMTNPQEMKYGMVEATLADTVVCVLKDVPAGICDLYVYQDLNGNHQLDKDENQIPVEPCFMKEKMKVKEGAHRMEVKLMNVKEMMGRSE